VFALGEKEITYGNIGLFSLEEAKEKVGSTPLVLLNENGGVKLYAKVEATNPMGTGKMRGAVRFFERAVNHGLLDSRQEIVLSSGGGFGIAIASMARFYDLPVTTFLLEEATEKVKGLLLSCGVNIIDSATNRTERNQSAAEYTRKVNGLFFNQHEDTPGFLAAYAGTAPEIWQQTQGEATDIVAGFGTAMTAFGVGKFMRDVANLYQTLKPRITAVESDSSLLWLFLELQKANVVEQMRLLCSYAERGIIELKRNKRGKIVGFSPAWQEKGYIPGTGVSGLSSFSQDIFPLKLIDQSIQVTPRIARVNANDLQSMGISAGISSGAVYQTCVDIFSQAVQRGEPKTIVGIFMDDRRMYESLLD
jgi:cysteine synthase